MPSLIAAAALMVLVVLPFVSAHGYVASITAGGKTYKGAEPTWMYGTKPQTPGWFAWNTDTGFIEPAQYGNASAIPCHRGATPGNTQVTVAAGSTVTLNWNTWPESHHGPVIDYLAKCSGSCTTATAGSLVFTKIAATGLVNGASPPGRWGSDSIVPSPYVWKVQIPSSLAAGNYVLRHEIIALHSAGSQNGAQNYPQCINLQVTGCGSKSLSGGVAGTALYKATDPGILINIYTKISSYTIPGPTLWSG